MQRPPGVTSANRAPWRLVLASLAAVLVGAVTIGGGAFSTQTAVTPTPTSTAPRITLGEDSTVTPTPRVIAVPGATPSPTPGPTRVAIMTPSAVTPPTVAATEEPLPLATVTPTPLLVVAAAPTATPRPRATIVPSPTLAPSPSPTLAAPSPTVAPTRVPSPAVRLTFGAADWVGGFYRGDGQAYGRPWTAVYGASSAYPRASLPFGLDVAPVGTAVVTVAGLDDEWAARNEIALEVNGQVVFSGPAPFANWDGVGNGADAAWTRAQFSIPAGSLRTGTNEIALANLTPASSFNAPPYILVSEVTLDLATGDLAATQPDAERDDPGKNEKAEPPGHQKKEKSPAANDHKKPKKQKSNPGNGHGAKKGHKKGNHRR